VDNKFELDDFGGAVPLPDSLLFPPAFSSASSLFAFDILGAAEFAKGKLSTDEQRQVNLVDNLSLTMNLERAVPCTFRKTRAKSLAF